MCKHICNYLKRNCFCLLVFLLSVLLSIVIVYILYGTEKMIENIYYIVSMILAFFLLVVAYLNLNKIDKSITSKFLYEIDQRWGEGKILEARSILHKIILESKGSEQENYVADKLVSYYKDKSKTNEIILIINFLEFMETIGYLIYQDKTIAAKQVKNLCGYEVKYFYPIFEDLIRYMRKDYKDESLFKNFEKMHNDRIFRVGS